MNLATFEQMLAHDSTLRDAYVAHLDGLIASENTLDRVDATRTLDYQRGKVVALRKLKERALQLETHKENKE